MRSDSHLNENYFPTKRNKDLHVYVSHGHARCEVVKCQERHIAWRKSKQIQGDSSRH